MLIVAVMSALGGELPVWDADTFPRNTDIAGRDGWQTGYEDDAWYGAEDGDWAMSATDDGGQGEDRFLSGGPADDWLINGDDVGDGRIVAEGAMDDDDTLGIVFHADGEGVYVAGWSSDSVPPPYRDRVDRPTVFLVRVQGRDVTLLAEQRAERNDGEQHRFDLTVNDGHLTLIIDDRNILEVDDPSPLPAGQAGFYAYNSGWDGGNGSTYAAFDYIEVTAMDDDDDDVADDIDNCEFVANTDQTDYNNDGAGDACDPPPPAEDTSVDDTSGGGGELDGDEALVAGCGCNGAGQGAGGAVAGLLVLLLRRRR